MAPAQTVPVVITLAMAVVFLLVTFAILIVFLRTFRPWMQATMTGTPVSVFDILGMRFRRIDVNAVLKALIMTRQAGVALSCRQVESAYLQGVDLEKLTWR
jgi:uncharacterized protein YqfA (UPF0365 family)